MGWLTSSPLSVRRVYGMISSCYQCQQNCEWCVFPREGRNRKIQFPYHSLNDRGNSGPFAQNRAAAIIFTELARDSLSASRGNRSKSVRPSPPLASA
jgi:hypothetical protein